MYEFVTGPLAWLAFSVFFVGLAVRVVLYVKWLSWQLDRVTYTVNTGYGIKGAVKSIFFWVVPFGSRAWRDKPLFTLVSFAFHAGLVITPVFLLAHNMILREKWGIRFVLYALFLAFRSSEVFSSDNCLLHSIANKPYSLGIFSHLLADYLYLC